jgi:hypothetical protein
MQSLQDPRKLAAGRHPPARRHADLEAGSVPKVSVMQEGPSRAARAHDQADGTAGHHALQMGASWWRQMMEESGLPTDAALLVNLAELLFSLSYQPLNARFRQIVLRSVREHPELDNFDFESNALVFVSHLAAFHQVDGWRTI